jgi:SpoVK/Ycf46/Vps4 family AAA+-type ATPase
MGFFDDSKRAKLEDEPPNTKPNQVNEAVEVKTETTSRTFQLEVTEPQWQLEELILPNETKEAIQQAANTILVSPIVDNWLGNRDKVGRRIAVNFYGPPGTGKTSAADALAALLSLKIMIINYADLESRFVGETPKNVRLAFRQAQEAKALLFFDEADSILSRRFTNLSQASEAHVNQTRSTMMIELDKFQGVVVFATNLQENYDDAFVRRIAAHIRFSLPSYKLRVRLWQMYMPPTLPRANDVSSEKLADLSKGFSPADIATAVRQAAVMAATRKGESQKVLLTDLEKAAYRIRSAKQEVGTKANSSVQVSQTTISRDEIPAELIPNRD